LIILLYAFVISIVAHPACRLLKGKATYKECLSFLILVLSFYMMITSIIIQIPLEIVFLNVGFSVKNLFIIVGAAMLVIIPYFFLLLRSLYCGLSELYGLRLIKIVFLDLSLLLYLPRWFWFQAFFSLDLSGRFLMRSCRLLYDVSQIVAIVAK
jgi:hypothetical protein